MSIRWFDKTDHSGRVTPRVKYPYIGGIRWAFMQWADIPDASQPNLVYLRRLRLIQTPWRSLYIHWIYAPDDDRDPHNHPFEFWSLVLKGGYVENRTSLHDLDPIGGFGLIRSVGERTRKRFSLAKTRRNDFHRILRLSAHPTVTLVLTRGRSKWGFLTPKGFVPSEQYVAAKEANWGEVAAG